MRPGLRIEPAGGEIIEEEQGLRALDHEVVDAHGDEVDADRVEDAGVDGDLQLGADAVSGGDQHRIAVAGGLEVEQAAETADFGVGAGPPRRAHERLDRLDKGISGVDIDAGIGIGHARFSGSVGHGFEGLRPLAPKSMKRCRKARCLAAIGGGPPPPLGVAGR